MNYSNMDNANYMLGGKTGYKSLTLNCMWEKLTMCRKKELKEKHCQDVNRRLPLFGIFLNDFPNF